jgi:hypothetical protein
LGNSFTLDPAVDGRLFNHFSGISMGVCKKLPGKLSEIIIAPQHLAAATVAIVANLTES